MGGFDIRMEGLVRRHWGSAAASPGGPSAEGLLPLRIPQGKFILTIHRMVFYPPAGGPFPSSPITLMNNINKDRP